jgi:hypothetical protein
MGSRCGSTGSRFFRLRSTRSSGASRRGSSGSGFGRSRGRSSNDLSLEWGSRLLHARLCGASVVQPVAQNRNAGSVADGVFGSNVQLALSDIKQIL